MKLEEWLEQKELNLYIKENYFHHHAYEIIVSNESIYNHFYKVLNTPISIEPRIKKSKGGTIESIAIKADDLNKKIRQHLKSYEENLTIHLEVLEENGVFYFATGEKNAIGGFDFAILNNESNLISLRNLCFGDLQYHDGQNRWDKFIAKNQNIKDLAEEILHREGLGKNITKLKSSKNDPLIVGEIQFGNWALAYRDFFKVLKADVLNNIDCLIYIVPTGNLEKLLSDGIVTFDKTVKIIESFSKVINVPVWLIGIDVDI
ncbi:hypothetical protein CHU00_15715 [Sphingobacterium cellulitidis]|uniref:BglII/BstYI family type II restriction endonuclease n=1 Tax=Sphingobacterium cellulitidis TaxID=1768011 RepID=UPI000B9414AF|nr:BglII/BstYI family type II restriction endonuclease [Sphingobacterium cellulitidis]OYD44640.1 hypothetical protein CHU00_15715 [Sphingobacterium cellulitidis]